MEKRKKILSFILVFIMAIASVSFPTHLVAATGNYNFTGNGFNVIFTVQSSWSNGYSANMEIVNTSSQPIEEWNLVLDTGLNAGNISGGRILSQSATETVIAHAEWNSVIPAGSSVNLSINGTHSGVTPVPTSYQLISAKDENTASRRLIPAHEYSIQQIVHHETSNSFNNAIVLTNNTGGLVYGWEVEFDIPPGVAINTAFVANVSQDVIQSGSRVTLSKITGSGIVWHPGMAMHIQLMGTKSSNTPVAFTNFAVYERTAVNDNTPTPTPTPTPAPLPGTHLLTILSGEGGRVVNGTDGYYAADSEIKLEVEADEGYVFTGWKMSNGGEFYFSLLNPFNLFLMPDSATTITANFVYMCDTDSNGNGIPDWYETLFYTYLPDEDINKILSWLTSNDHIPDEYNPAEYPPSFQILPESNISPKLLSNDNWLIPSISGTVYGIIDRHLWLNESWKIRFFKEHRALLSPVIDVATSYDLPLALTFTATTSLTSYAGNLNSLFIMHWDGDDLHPIETVVNGVAGTLTATIQGAGVYFVMDLDEFLKGVGIDVFADFVDMVEPMGFSMAFENDLFFEEQPPLFVLTDNYGNPIGEIPNPEYIPLNETDMIEAFSFESFTPFAATNNVIIADNNVKGKADIVFVIDTTGSMGWIVNNVSNNIENFAEKLVNEFNIDANFALVDFKDITSDGIDSTRVIHNGTSNWFTDAKQFSVAVRSLPIYGGGDIPETPIDGLEMARRLDFRPNASRFIILVTDACYKVDNRFGITSMAEMANLLADDGVITSVISRTWEQHMYSVLYESTDGVFGDIYSNFSNILLQLADKIGEATDGYWIMLSNYQIVRLDGHPSEGHDTDGDGLLDSDELIAPFLADMTPKIEALLEAHAMSLAEHAGVMPLSAAHIAPMSGGGGGGFSSAFIEMWKFNSNPADKDSDGDGIPDYLDPEPMSPYDDRFEFVEHAWHRPLNSEVARSQQASNDIYNVFPLGNLQNHIFLRSAQTRAWLNVIGGAFADMPNAAMGLYHFLSNSGQTLSPSIRSLIDTSNARNNFRSNLDYFLQASEQMIKDGMTTTIASVDQDNVEYDDRFMATKTRGIGDNPTWSYDWQYFIGISTAAMTGTVSRNGNYYTAVINYFVDDFYGWVPGSFKIGGIVFDGEMAALHSHGLACEFRIDGRLMGIEVTWSKGQRLGASDVLGEPIIILPQY